MPLCWSSWDGGQEGAATSVPSLGSVARYHPLMLTMLTHLQFRYDDVIGYAYSAAATDRTKPFLSLLFGHIANYQSRGSFNAPEQLAFTGDGPSSDSVRDIMYVTPTSPRRLTLPHPPNHFIFFEVAQRQ